MTVSDEIYQSAVRGRQEFRTALRVERAKFGVAKEIVDAYGLALMMIKAGVSDPSGFAANALQEVQEDLKDIRK